MTTNHRRRILGFALLAICTSAACSGGNEVAEITTVAPSAAGAATTTSEVVDDTAAVDTTVDTAVDITVADTVTTEAVASTVADSGLTGPMFSDALGIKVASAPGVNTAGDTRQLLPEGLYVHLAWEPDPNDPSVFTVQPDDIEILEAYANAASAFYRSALKERTTDAEEFEKYFVDGGTKFDAAFAQARSGGYVKVLGNGVVLRPYVLGDNRTPTEAIVLDCALSHEQWVFESADRVGLPDPAMIGTVATVVVRGSQWIVDTVAEEPQACL